MVSCQHLTAALRTWKLLLTLLLAVLPGTAGFIQDIFQFRRRTTCLSDNQRYLGYASNICEGEYPGQFEGMVMYLADIGVFNYDELRLDTARRDGIMLECAKNDFGGPNQTARPSNLYCAQGQLYDLGFMGGSICDNKFWHHEMNQTWPKDPLTETMYTLSQGCAQTCSCCGGEDCHNIFITTPASAPAPPPAEHGATPAAHNAAPADADADAELPANAPPSPPNSPLNPPNPPQPMGLLLYFHPYMGDASWATSQFNLHKLVDSENLMIMAPNGRTDDMGHGYWMGTDHFTGLFVNTMDANGDRLWNMDFSTYAETGMPTPMWQTMATTPEQLNQLMTNNPDVSHMHDVLMQMLDPDTTAIDRRRIYVMGSGNGGDMAYRMACEYPGLFAGMILHDAIPFQHNPDACRYSAPMHVLIHQHKKEDEDQLAMVQYFAEKNGCMFNEPNKNSPPNKEVQLLYNSSDLIPKYFTYPEDCPYPDLVGQTIMDSVVYEVDTHYCVKDSSVTLWISATVDDNTDSYDPVTYPALLRDWFRNTAQPVFEREPVPETSDEEDDANLRAMNYAVPGELNPLAASVGLEVPKLSKPGDLFKLSNLMYPAVFFPVGIVFLGCIALGFRYYQRRLAYQKDRPPRLHRVMDLASSSNFNHYGTFEEVSAEPDEGTALLNQADEDTRTPKHAQKALWYDHVDIMA